MNECVKFEVPLVPPTVNMYVRHLRSGKHYVTDEAQAFKDAVALLSAGQHVDERAKAVKVWIEIYQGKGDRGDIDNYPKCVLDGLKGCVFKSDAMVKIMVVHLHRDVQRPRTVIEVWPVY